MEPGAAPTTLVSKSFRQRLKGKERKLQPLAGYRYHVAATEADVTRLLDWFFRVKPLRMAEQKLPNVFAEAGIEEFIRSACCRTGLAAATASSISTRSNATRK